MTRNEFISKVAGEKFSLGAADGTLAAELAVEAAERLALALEAAGKAPWMEKSEKFGDTTKEGLMQFFDDIMEKVRGGVPYAPPEPSVSDFVPFGAVQVTEPGVSLSKVLDGISAKLPKNAGLIPGNWEIGFRPAKVDGSIIIPFTPAKKDPRPN